MLVVAGCMSGGQAIVLLIVLLAPLWVPFTGYPLQWACRIARTGTPDFDRALQVSFAELIVAVLIIFASVLAYHYLAVDLATSMGVAGLSTAGVAAVAAVYVTMLRVTYPKALLIALVRYAVT